MSVHEAVSALPGSDHKNNIKPGFRAHGRRQQRWGAQSVDDLSDWLVGWLVEFGASFLFERERGRED